MLALLALVTAACAPSVRLKDRPTEPLRFIHPKSPLSMSGMSGVDIPVQVWVLQHEDNRVVDITWGGANCAGRFAWTLDGKYEAAVQPPMGPFNVRMGPGLCTIVAEVLGPGGKLRHRAVYEMRICGGEASCTGDGTK
jgi:hypothetical protein